MISMIRQKLDTIIRAGLFSSCQQGRPIAMEMTPKGLLFREICINLYRYLFGIIPLYRIEFKGGKSRISFEDGIAGPLKAISTELGEQINGAQVTIWDTVTASLVPKLKTRVDELKATTLQRFKKGLGSFHGTFLANLLKRSRQDYRKSMTEAMRANCETLLSGGTQRMLASILLQVMKQQQKNIDRGFTSSGVDALPNNCRFVYRRGRVTTFLIEQIPATRTITCRSGTYRIALPYVVFMVTLSDKNFAGMRIFFRNSPLRSEESELFCPALPNVHSNNYVICFPYPTERHEDPNIVIESAIQNFWGSKFNSDLTALFENAASRFPQMANFEAWQRSSLEDPSFVLKLNWTSTNMSVASAAKVSIDAVNDGVTSTDNEDIDVYIAKASKRLAQETAEKLHFMAEHTPTDDTATMRVIEGHFHKLMTENFDALQTSVDAILTVPSTEKTIGALCKKARGELARKLAETTTVAVQNIQTEFQELTQ